MEPARIEPGPGQESVWDYPRPPALEQTSSHLRVEFGGATIADTTRAYRVLETSQPPAYYFPPDDVDLQFLVATPHRSFCEWKGQAHYYTVVAGGKEAPDAVWSYGDPVEAFRAITGYLAFYPQRMDACFVDDERVQPNEGSFYGGWITSKIVGPFKGGRGKRRLVKIVAQSVFEGVVYHCAPLDLSNPCRPTLEVDALLRKGDADAESGPLLLPVADYIRMLGIDVARPCLEELVAKGRIVQRLDVDHISFPTWTPHQ